MKRSLSFCIFEDYDCCILLPGNNLRCISFLNTEPVALGSTIYPSELKTVTAKAASFGSVPASRNLKKCAAHFFKRSKSSSVAVTQPAGCGGEVNESTKRTIQEDYCVI
jgi:hypothetical protein